SDDAVPEGTVMASLPSFGVLAASVVKVLPPSVDSLMFTLADNDCVLLTFQVTVCVLPMPHIMPVALGYDILNGPALLLTVTVISRLAVCPPFGEALS